MSSDNSLERLARIETQMDVLSKEMRLMRQLIERMVSVEERQTSHDQAMQRMGRRLDEIEDSIKEIEQRLSRNSWAVGAIERVWWIMVSAAVGMVAYIVRAGGV